MAYPVAKSFSAESGATIHAPPITDPAWLAGTPLNEWVAIANTSGADGNKIDAWCGFAVVPATSELIIPIAGGHGDDWHTNMSSIGLRDDAPAWKSPRRRNSIPIELANPNQPYCLDGVTPSSRHTRYSALYCPQNNRIMLMGSPSVYGGGGTSFTESNGFDLATNEWDAPGTWPSLANNSNQGTCIDDVGNIWCRGQKWIRATNTLVTIASGTYRIVDFDTARRQIFALSRSDGQSTTGALIMRTISEDLSVSRNITFNASAAWDTFNALTLEYSAMFYDPVRDRFLYYYGIGAGRGVIFVITPNAGTVWDMSILATTGSVLPPAPGVQGINARFKYVAQLDGAVLMPNQASDIYFIRLG